MLTLQYSTTNKQNMNTIYSMTGFGRTIGEYNGKRFTIELKSLNSKNIDLGIKIPTFYREKEPEIRTLLSEKLIRGKIDLMMFVEQSDYDHRTHINKTVFKSYYNQIKELYHELGEPIGNEVLASITRFPDVLEATHEEIDAQEWQLIRTLIDNAIESTITYRQIEGQSIYSDLNNKLKNIIDLKSLIIPLEPQRKENIRTRLNKSLAEFIENETLDSNRFEQELIYYIEKYDINEERVRLKQHLNYFSETLIQGGNIGRKLGFIAQEIGREINTLGAKANHNEIQKIVVEMKNELEQIKEQVLNIL